MAQNTAERAGRGGKPGATCEILAIPAGEIVRQIERSLERRDAFGSAAEIDLFIVTQHRPLARQSSDQVVGAGRFGSLAIVARTGFLEGSECLVQMAAVAQRIPQHA